MFKKLILSLTLLTSITQITHTNSTIEKTIQNKSKICAYVKGVAKLLVGSFLVYESLLNYKLERLIEADITTAAVATISNGPATGADEQKRTMHRLETDKYIFLGLGAGFVINGGKDIYNEWNQVSAAA